ncbi:MAG: hypothetical protein LBS19_08230 [Clostridiales bacterium]|jgi:hypothetical protein|nr:hypothetical protein [Clostridiales bacterium]
MAKPKPIEISVTTVFDGKQDGRQVFIDLIIKRRRDKMSLESKPQIGYNNSKVFSDVRVV